MCIVIRKNLKSLKKQNKDKMHLIDGSVFLKHTAIAQDNPLYNKCSCWKAEIQKFNNLHTHTNAQLELKKY